MYVRRKNMIYIIFTQGNEEKEIAFCNTLAEAKNKKRELEKSPEYSNGLLTIEVKTNKGSRILG